MLTFLLQPGLGCRRSRFHVTAWSALNRSLPRLRCARARHVFLAGREPHIHVVRAAANQPREKLLKTTDALGVPRETADRVFAAAERVVRDWTSTTTEFLTPPESEVLTEALGSMADLYVNPWGGYGSAERRVLLLARADVVDDEGQSEQLAQADLACLGIEGNFLFDVASHRDFLGAILGSGITRQKVGDIIVQGDRGCQAVVSADIAEFLQTTLTSVRSVPVKVERIEWERLDVRSPSVKELTMVEASMRLDAVASAGFSMSRSKLNGMIKAGDCQVNYQAVSSPSKALKEGDAVSIRGKGKLTVGEVTLTAKGRYRIQVTRKV
jgi:photosystem II S4 domain protein